jgi:hypothetical protein
VEVESQREYCFRPLIGLSDVQDLSHKHEQGGDGLRVLVAKEVSYDCQVGKEAVGPYLGVRTPVLKR